MVPEGELGGKGVRRPRAMCSVLWRKRKLAGRVSRCEGRKDSKLLPSSSFGPA